MPTYETGQAILTDVLARASEAAIGTSDRETDAKRYIQAAYVAVVGEGYPWAWAKKSPPGVLQTTAPITTGTVTATTTSTAITFTSGPAASVAGRKFVVDADGIVYRIATHTAGSTSATLDAAYLGDGGSGLAFHVMQDEYALASDFLRPLGKPFLRDMHTSSEILLIQEDELVTDFPYPAHLGTPTHACLIGAQTVRLAKTPSAARRYEYAYLRHPTSGLSGGILPFDGTANDTLIIQPPEDRIVVAFFALANLLVDKNDSAASIFAAAAQSKLNEMRKLALKLSRPRQWVGRAYRVSSPR